MSAHVSLAGWLGVAAAILLVVGSVAALLIRAAPAETRVPLLGGLTAWLAIDVLLGSVGAFAAGAHRALPGIAAGIAAPVLLGVWLLGRHGAAARAARELPPATLIGVQVYRVAGVVFILAWAYGPMPGAFALPAGIGDLAVGLSAPLVAARVAAEPQSSRTLAIRWNILGIADLLLAVALGALTSPTPFQPIALAHPNLLISRLPFVLIPVFAVPISLLLHLVTLRRLDAVGRPQRPPALRRQAVGG